MSIEFYRQGSVMALWLECWTGVRGGGFDPHSGAPCCVFEQDTFTSLPTKVLVIPRKLYG